MEIAGTAHADNYTIQVAPIDTGTAALADIVAAYAPTDMLMGQQLDHCINFAPQHHCVLQAALSHFSDWVRTGQPPPSAAPIEFVTATAVLDAEGMRQGGVRTPWVDVPVARTSGVGGEENTMSSIFGSGEPFDAATVQRLYPGGVADDLERFAAALDSAIQAGFLLPLIATEIVELAAATFPGVSTSERGSLEGQAEQGVCHAEQKFRVTSTRPTKSSERVPRRLMRWTRALN